MWVMPSSSARCAQLPRAADKVPFYAALKKFRDYLNGHIPHMDEAECVFTDPKFKACYETDAKPDLLIGANSTSFADVTDISNSGVNSAMNPTTVIGSQISPAAQIHIGINPANHQMGGTVHTLMGGGGGDDVPGKKKRGRPKKIRLADGEEPKITPPRRTPAQQQLTLDGEMPKKKRGRPKKIKSDMMNVMDMSGGGGVGGAAVQSAGPTGMDPSADVMMGMCSSLNTNRMFPMHQQQPPSQHQQHQPQHQQNQHQHHHQHQQQHHQQNHQNQQQHQQHHLHPHQQHPQNSPNPNPFGPIAQQQQQHLQHQSSSTPPMRYGSMLMNAGSIPSPNDLSGLQSYHHQQQSSPQQQQFTHADLSSEISAAISTSEQHLGGPIGGGALNTGVGTTKSPAQTPPNQHCTGQSDFDNNASGSIHDENNTSNDCGPNNTGSTGGFASPAPSTHSEHGGISHLQQQQQHNASYSPYRSTPNSVYMEQRTNESNDGYMQPQVSAGGRLHTVMEQQQQDSPHHTHGGDVYKLPDVASKSLSGLESLVDQIPNLNDSESASSNSSLTAVGAAGVLHGLNETRMHDTSGSTAATLSEQYQTSCLYGGYTSGLNDSMLAAGAGGSVNPPISGASAPHYPSAQFSPQNSIGCGSPTVPPAHHPIAGPQQQQQQQSYAGLSSPFSVSSLTASANYPTAATMNSYHSNLLAVHHGGGGGASSGSGMLNGGAAPPSMYMEPHMPMPVNPLYHHPAYGQHGGYSGYGPAVVAAPPPTIHMPSPNYPYGYGNAGAYGQPTHHPAAGHPATGYLANHHHSIFDRIKPDIGYGGF